MKDEKGEAAADRPDTILEEDHYMTPQGLLVFTEKYHLKRGYCCQSGCRHCPYGFVRRDAEGVPRGAAGGKTDRS